MLDVGRAWPQERRRRHDPFRLALTLLVRTGRSADYKREMLKRLWSMIQGATGAPDDQIVLGIQEVPASQAMEMGKIMPDVADQ